VPQQGGNGFQTHAAIDSLRGQGMAQSVRSYAFVQPGQLSGAFDCCVNPTGTHTTPVDDK